MQRAWYLKDPRAKQGLNYCIFLAIVLTENTDSLTEEIESTPHTATLKPASFKQQKHQMWIFLLFPFFSLSMISIQTKWLYSSCIILICPIHRSMPFGCLIMNKYSTNWLLICNDEFSIQGSLAATKEDQMFCRWRKNKNFQP